MCRARGAVDACGLFFVRLGFLGITGLAIFLCHPLQSQGALQFVLPSEHGREVAGAGLVRASCWWQGACSTVRSCRRVVTLGAVFAWSCQPRGAALPVRAVAYRGGGGRW